MRTSRKIKQRTTEAPMPAGPEPIAEQKYAFATINKNNALNATPFVGL